MENKLEQRYCLKKELYMSCGLFIQIRSNRKSIDAGLIMEKPLITKKLDTENEDLALSYAKISLLMTGGLKIV